MTLLHMDGFDLGDEDLRFENSVGTTSTTTRFGLGRSFSGQNGSTGQKSFTASDTVVVGFAYEYTGSSGGRAQVQFRGDLGATSHIVCLLTTSAWEVRLGTDTGNLLITTSTPSLGWNYIEFKVKVNNSTGLVHVRMNGATSNDFTFSGDTKNAGTNDTIDQIRMGAYGGGSNILIDDFYILNTLGSTCNDFLGDVRIATLLPNGNGNRSQLVGSDGNSTDNYLLVDEAPYSTADYVGSATIGNGDTYTMGNMPSTPSTIHAAQVAGILAKSDAGASSAKLVLRRAGTDYLSGSVTLGTTYDSFVNIYETDPSTSAAWTETNINAAETGMEVA